MWYFGVTFVRLFAVRRHRFNSQSVILLSNVQRFYVRKKCACDFSSSVFFAFLHLFESHKRYIDYMRIFHSKTFTTLFFLSFYHFNNIFTYYLWQESRLNVIIVASPSVCVCVCVCVCVPVCLSLCLFFLHRRRIGLYNKIDCCEYRSWLRMIFPQFFSIRDRTFRVC